jgi:predicted Zn-dependent protease
VRQPVRRWPVLALIGFGALGALWYVGSFLLADARFHQADLLWGGGELSEARRQYDLALSFRDDYEYRRRYARQLSERVSDVDESAASHYERATELLSFLDDFPQVNTVIEQARLVRSRSQVEPELQERALEIFERAFEIDPLNPIIRVEYSEMLVQLEREDEAARLMEAFAGEVGHDQYPEFWGMLAWSRALTGDEAGAREALEVAVALNPEDSRAANARQLLDEEEGAS